MEQPAVVLGVAPTGSIFPSLALALVAVRAGQDAAHEVIGPAGLSHARLLFQAGVG